jgi:adenosylhomocysteine nucleosidase
LSVVILACVAIGCGDNGGVTADQEEPAYIALTVAYPRESWLIEQNLVVHEADSIADMTFYIGELMGADVIFYECGIGPENAERSTNVLLYNFNVSAVVFSGICGGIDPVLRIGDVSVSERWGSAIGHPEPNEEDFWIDVDAEMLAVAAEVARGVELLSEYDCPSYCELAYTPVVITHGDGVTYDRFVTNEAMRSYLWTTYQARTTDNETYFIAKAAREHGVPFIAFRAVDGIASYDDYEIYWALAANNAAITALAFLQAWTAQ